MEGRRTERRGRAQATELGVGAAETDEHLGFAGERTLAGFDRQRILSAFQGSSTKAMIGQEASPFGI